MGDGLSRPARAGFRARSAVLQGLQRLQGLIARPGGAPISDEDRAAFDAEGRERDLRRVRVLVPMALLLHAAHIVLHRVPAPERALSAPNAVLWHDLIVRLHGATIPAALLLLGIAWLAPHSRAGRLLMPLTAAVYLSHGAMASSIDQIEFVTMNAFTGYCLGVAVICAFPLSIGLWVYGVGWAVLVVAMSQFQSDAAIRMSNLLNGATVVTMSLGLSALVGNARRRDFRQRRIIARQRDELAGLNADLERRVDEQVAEILKRSDEVMKLNAQLRSQIRTRSSELSIALAQLARERGEETTLKPGDVVGDRFELGDSIGAGGMGVVYSARDRITGGAVAVKVIRASAQIPVDSMRRFLAEAGAIATISHPAVVRMVHVDISGDGLLYQAQELVEGRSLEEAMEQGPWPEEAVARLGAVLLQALAAAHEHGVIHRDVKPSNVMLIGEEPGLKLLDFGLAKLYQERAHERPHGERDQTEIGLVVGTPAYMAPEQVLAGDVSDKADVYACGVLLFQLLTGRLAFEADGPSKVMMSHVAVEAPDLRTLDARISAELSELVAACLSKDPARRPTAAEAGRRLVAFADAHGAASLAELIQGSETEPVVAPAAEARHRSIARRLKGPG